MNYIKLNEEIIHSVSSYIIENSNEEIVFLNVDNDNDVIKLILEKFI